MGILSKIFTWWDGATIGTCCTARMNGEQVGTDAQGNRYFRCEEEKAAGRRASGAG